jgi:8-oxo-dGTP pyrophosphatase MutT (NUDIX family)
LVSFDLMEPRVELLEELRQYRAADSAEGQHLRDVLDLLSYGLAPFARDSFVPGHITASVFIVDPGTKRLLLHHHRRLDRWLQMGGHVNLGERIPEAALREGAEESGLDDLELIDGVADVDVHEIPAANGEPEHCHYDVRYVARTKQPDKIRIAGAESKDLSWVDLDQAVAMMNEEGSQRVIMKLRKLL